MIKNGMITLHAVSAGQSGSLDRKTIALLKRVPQVRILPGALS
jgi:hypothetical protein